MSEAEIDEADFNTAVLVFAHYLGIDLESEKELLPIAENALRNLPQGWELGIGDGDNAGIPYFFNESTGESIWKHPKEGIYLKKVKEEKKRLQVEAEDRKKSRKADTSANSRSQNQQRNQNDRRNDDTSKGSKNDSNKGRGAVNQNSVEDFEVTEVSDFFLDDEDDSLGKSTIRRNTAANAVVSKKKGVSDGGNYGMSSADFLSDDEEIEEKNLRGDDFLKKTDSKGKVSTWSDANSNHSEREKEKEKEVKPIKSRSESLSWDDESVGTSHNQSRRNSLDKRSDQSSAVRGREEVPRIGGKSDDRRSGDYDKVVDKTGSRAGSGRSSPGKADVSERSRERQNKERDIRERESKDRENKERETREGENRDRENKEREARERDIRDAETREREKNRLKLREKEAASNAALSSSAISSEVAALKADNRDLEDRLADLRNRHKQVMPRLFPFHIDTCT